MRRLACRCVLVVAGLSGSAAAYDGPGTPLVYNQFINNITVLMTVQPQVLNGGITRFTMTAQVPIEADTIGKDITLQIRRYAPETIEGYIVLDSCARTPAPGSVGTTVSFSCDAEQFASVGTGLAAGGVLGVYPWVQRPADSPVSVLTHDGVAHRLNVPVVGEDADDGGVMPDGPTPGLNDTIMTATDLGTPVSPLVKNNLVSFKPDYYRFTVPPGSGSMEIRIDFWNAAADIDLFLLDSGGNDLTSSPFSEDFEQVNWDVNPGEVYYIRMEQASTQPGFYNLTIIFTIRDILTITSGPTANPAVVSAGGTTTVSAAATDSVGHTINYFWSQVCPMSIGNGTFADRSQPSTTWTAPENTTGSPKQCTLRITVDDSRENSATATVPVTVGMSGDVITFTVPPSGTPNPVTGPASVALTTEATDSFGHPLSYSWTANCPTLPNNGIFKPNASQRTPAWEPAANVTGAAQVCTLTVTAGDGFGVAVSAGYAQQVAPTPHLLTIAAGPAGTPNPVASSGAAALSVNVVDTFGHGLAYAWTATCGGGLGNGSFTNGATPTPTWTAPANTTGVGQTCSIQVTVDDGAFGLSQTASYVQTVNPAVNTITITAGPNGAPNPAASGAAVAASVVATDLFGRTLGYAWTATCTGGIGSGSFADGATASPVWTAPANLTGVARSCTIGVTVSDAFGSTANGSYQQLVNPAPNPVTITAGPAGTPNPVPSGSAVAVSVTASDVLGRTLVYAWTATCPVGLGSGGFTNGTTAAPSWTAPSNPTGQAQICTIGVSISDGFGNTQIGSYQQTVDPAPNPISITAGPTGTPNPVPSGGTVALSVTASDVLGRPLTYAWSAACAGGIGSGGFTGGTTATPGWSAPANLTGAPMPCTISVIAGDAFGNTKSGSYEQVVDPAPNAITITAGPGGTPNPVPSGGPVDVTVAATDQFGRTLAFVWSASCAGGLGNGSFANAAASTTTWTAPANLTATPHACSIDVTVTDGFGASAAGSYSQHVLPVGCTYTLTPTATSQGATGGSGSVSVSAPNGCAWLAVSSASWLTITAGQTGAGNGLVAFTVDPNADPGPRDAILTIAGLQVPVTQAGAGYTYYFAEGATINEFFETRVALLNDDATTAATVDIDFQLKDTTTVLTHSLSVPAHSRVTLDVSTLGSVNPALAVLASAEFSTVIRSDLPLVADRTMTWTRAQAYGSHGETAITAPAATWYLAEGATIGNFELYYLIQNPNAEAITFTVTYLLPPPTAPLVRVYPIGANTRTNIPVHLEPGLEDVEVSAIIEAPADKPIIVERAMYLTTGGLFYGAGHESAGIRAPATQWFFAEGNTGTFFDLFILIGNPGTTTAQVTATFLFDDGTTCATGAAVDAKSRYNIWVDTLVIPGCPRDLADAAVSTTITAEVPVIAERAMWWPGPSAANWAEAHNAAGATVTGVRWGLADGEQGGARGNETYILIANTSAYAGTARVTLYLEDGSTLQKDVPLAANSRTNVAVGAPEASGGFGPAVAGKRFGAVIESLPVAGQVGPAQIVVERAMYSNGPGAPFWAAGTDVLATRLQ